MNGIFIQRELRHLLDVLQIHFVIKTFLGSTSYSCGLYCIISSFISMTNSYSIVILYYVLYGCGHNGCYALYLCLRNRTIFCFDALHSFMVYAQTSAIWYTESWKFTFSTALASKYKTKRQAKMKRRQKTTFLLISHQSTHVLEKQRFTNRQPLPLYVFKNSINVLSQRNILNFMFFNVKNFFFGYTVIRSIFKELFSKF